MHPLMTLAVELIREGKNEAEVKLCLTSQGLTEYESMMVINGAIIHLSTDLVIEFCLIESPFYHHLYLGLK